MTDLEEPAGSEPSQLVIHHSRFARELLALQPRVRLAMGAGDPVLILIDGAVRLCTAMTDPGDERGWSEKVESVFAEFEAVGRVHGPAVAAYITSLDKDGIERLLKRYGRAGYLNFARRLVGPAAFHRLHVALTEDCDLVAAACWRGIEAGMPYALAMDDIAGMLTPDQVRAILNANPTNGVVLEMSLQVLDFLDVTVDKITVPGHELLAMSQVRERRVSALDIDDLTKSLRIIVSGQSRALVKDLSAVLDRKLEGARHALEHSVDSVSQSATSLTEFIDRLMRSVFPQDEVMAWCAANYPELTLTHIAEGGVVRPTKRGQALCMLHGGQPVEAPSPLHVLIASGLVAIRKKLEHLKHNDQGTMEEIDEIHACLRGIEAFVTLGLRGAWSTLPDETLQAMKSRLDPAAAAPTAVARREAG